MWTKSKFVYLIIVNFPDWTHLHSSYISQSDANTKANDLRETYSNTCGVDIQVHPVELFE